MAHQKERLARQFAAALPFCRALNMAVDEIGDGFAVLSMPYDKALIGDPETGVLHGGAVSALLDSCSGTAVFLHPQSAAPTATIDLRIDYMRPARPGQRITAKAECYHVTSSVAFVRAQAFDADVNSPVAAATGAFTFKRMAKNQGPGA